MDLIKNDPKGATHSVMQIYRTIGRRIGSQPLNKRLFNLPSKPSIILSGKSESFGTKKAAIRLQTYMNFAILGIATYLLVLLGVFLL